MVKTFQKRVSKKNRVKIDLLSSLDLDVVKSNDQKVLRGAELQHVKLDEITVREQVRTRFVDKSIQELATNIRENGLIQPLVLHREGDKFVLICGERRYRAMSTIEEMHEAPCFILENKTHEELMAIQFSENSVRENLHYIDHSDSIMNYKLETGASERKITEALGVSKSEVHRCLKIAKLNKPIKEAAKEFNIEKYVLLDWDKIEDKALKNKMLSLICDGKIKRRAQFKKYMAELAH